MENFEKILLRLKERLCVQTDKEVAELLGLSVKAFTARKMRGSFPKDKLLALKANHPELYIDDAYILTGEKRDDISAAQFMAGSLRAQQLLLRGETKGNYEVGEPRSPYSVKNSTLTEKLSRLDAQSLQAVETMVDALLKQERN